MLDHEGLHEDLSCHTSLLSLFLLCGKILSPWLNFILLGFQKGSNLNLRHYSWLADADTGNCWKRGLDQMDRGAVGAQRLRELCGAAWSWEQDDEARHDVETSLDSRTQ